VPQKSAQHHSFTTHRLKIESLFEGGKMRFDLRNVGVKTKTIKNVVAGVEKKTERPLMGE
jgi:hypothetical protein